jgi:hypothetical protein
MELQPRRVREISWTIPTLKTKLDELDRQINQLRAERAQLGFKFNEMLKANAKSNLAIVPTPVPTAEVHWYSDMFGGTGFDNACKENNRG